MCELGELLATLGIETQGDLPTCAVLLLLTTSSDELLACEGRGVKSIKNFPVGACQQLFQLFRLRLGRSFKTEFFLPFLKLFQLNGIELRRFSL